MTKQQNKALRSYRHAVEDDRDYRGLRSTKRRKRDARRAFRRASKMEQTIDVD